LLNQSYSNQWHLTKTNYIKLAKVYRQFSGSKYKLIENNRTKRRGGGSKCKCPTKHLLSTILAYQKRKGLKNLK